MSLSATVGELEQNSRIRLELVQRDFTFQGLMLRIDPLAEGFVRAAVDTFIVTNGSISADFVSFAVTGPPSSTANFQGKVVGRNLSGTALGETYSGNWSVDFIF